MLSAPCGWPLASPPEDINSSRKIEAVVSGGKLSLKTELQEEIEMAPGQALDLGQGVGTSWSSFKHLRSPRSFWNRV